MEDGGETLVLKSDEPEVETLELRDGTSYTILRSPEMSDDEFREHKEHLINNPEETHDIQNFNRNCQALRNQAITQAFFDYYNQKLENGEVEIAYALEGLQEEREMTRLFEEIKKWGVRAILKFENHKELLRLINRKLGGVPAELRDTIAQIKQTPFTFHEAAKMGDILTVQKYIASPVVKYQPEGVDELDHNGLTPLAFAVGANHLPVVKALLEKKANPHKVDTDGSSSLHYAAGYGRTEMMTFLMDLKVSVDKRNKKGRTAMDVATQNGQKETIKILER